MSDRLGGRHRKSGAAVVVVGALLLSACRENPTTSGRNPRATRTPRASSDCTTFLAPPQGSPDTYAEADGIYAAFITGIDIEASTITFDPVQFYFGDAAKEPYQRDHPNEEGGPPNDYYIVNEDSRLRTLPVQADACLAVQADGGADSSRSMSDLESFAKALETQRDQENQARLSGNPFWVTIEARKVVAIRQQFVP